MKEVKRLIPWVIAIMVFEALIFYRFGREDAMTDLRGQYPHVINFRKPTRRIMLKPGDLWITDTTCIYYVSEELKPE